MLARLFQSSGSKSLTRKTWLTTSPRAFITLTSDKNVGLIDESFHKDILRNQEDLSISKTYKDGVLFYSWHLKDIEKYKEVLPILKKNLQNLIAILYLARQHYQHPVLLFYVQYDATLYIYLQNY